MTSQDVFVSQSNRLLTESDGASFEITNPDGDGNIVLVCEHASNCVPERFVQFGPVRRATRQPCGMGTRVLWSWLEV